MAWARTAITLVELLVVICIVGVLLAISLPVIHSVRSAGQRATCQSNMRQTLHAFTMYGNDNHGFVPRDFGIVASREPGWQIQIARYLGASASLVPADLKRISAYQCPAHPLVALLPGSFVINAIAMESAPNWAPAGYSRVSQMKGLSTLPWLFDLADQLGEKDAINNDYVLFPQYHDVWSPATFARRVATQRHGSGSNVGFLDGHVERRSAGELRFEDLDDGIRAHPF